MRYLSDSTGALHFSGNVYFIGQRQNCPFPARRLWDKWKPSGKKTLLDHAHRCNEQSFSVRLPHHKTFGIFHFPTAGLRRVNEISNVHFRIKLFGFLDDQVLFIIKHLYSSSSSPDPVVFPDMPHTLLELPVLMLLHFLVANLH